ncbi:MAG: hypothetical protein JXA91_08145 [Candidatus Thermoplasmatota archaeon]|nr:hypothetical protein [Candidatus Thermoplasmatota archaeon]
MSDFNENGDEITVKSIIVFVFDYRVPISLFILIGIILSLIIAFKIPPVYMSNSKLITRTTGNKTSQASMLAAMAGISIGGNQNTDPSGYLDQVIQDENFLKKIINKKWHFKGDSVLLDEIWKINPDTNSIDWEYRYYKRKLDKIRKGKLIKITQDMKNGVLTLSTLFVEPQLSYDINMFTIQLLADYIRNQIRFQAKEKRLFIQDRLKEVKSELENAENAYAIFQESNIFVSSAKLELESVRLQRQVTINQGIYLELQKQYEQARIDEENDQTLLDVIKNPEIPIDREKPKRGKIIVIGTLFGFLIGIVFSLVWQWMVINFFKSDYNCRVKENRD